MWFWPRMMAQVRGWVVSFEGCQRWKPVHLCHQTPLQILVPEGPWNRVAMDLMGWLPETCCSDKHVLVVADTFIKWMEALPVPNMAETMGEVVIR